MLLDWFHWATLSVFAQQPEVSEEKKDAPSVLDDLDLRSHYFDVAEADPALANNWKLIDEHVSKNGWTRLQSDELGTTSYFHDARADVIYSIDAYALQWKVVTDISAEFDIVHGYTDRRLRKWNKLPVHDQYFPTTMFG